MSHDRTADAGWVSLRPVRTRPSRRTVIQLLLGVLLYGAGANVSAGWVVVLAGVVIGSVPWAFVMSRRAARSIVVRRLTPATAVADMPVSVQLELEAPTLARAVVEDELTGAVGVADDLRNGAVLTTEAGLARGRPGSAPVTVTVADPFGLVRVWCEGAVPCDVEVLPPVPSVAAGVPAVRWAAQAGREARRAGHGAEVIGVRGYRPGDAARTVHWRATARRGELVVKELADDARVRVRTEIAPGLWDLDALDRATAAAAGLASAFRDAGLTSRIAADGLELPWGPPARRHLALLPPCAGREARALAATAAPEAVDVIMALRPGGAGLVHIDLAAGHETRELGTLPATAEPAELGPWLAARLTAGS